MLKRRLLQPSHLGIYESPLQASLNVPNDRNGKSGTRNANTSSRHSNHPKNAVIWALKLNLPNLKESGVCHP